MLSKELLDLLCCPKCRVGLIYDAQKQSLTCTSCGHVFAIRNGIPVMLLDEKSTEQSKND